MSAGRRCTRPTTHMAASKKSSNHSDPLLGYDHLFSPIHYYWPSVCEAIIYFLRFELRSITRGNEVPPCLVYPPSLACALFCTLVLLASAPCVPDIYFTSHSSVQSAVRCVDSCTWIGLSPLYRENPCSSVRVLIGVLGLLQYFLPSMPISTSFGGSTLCHKGNVVSQILTT